MRRKELVKRVVALSMAAIMTAGLSACGKGNEGGSSQVKEDGTIDTSSHEVITMLVLGNKPSNGRCEAMLEKLNEVLTEKVNAELKLHYVEWADWQTQYNTQLLSGDSSIDIITTATDWLYGWENAQKGAFMSLSEDMLKTYAPKTYEQVSEDGDWDICKLDGEIQFIPEDNFTQYTNHGFFYRGDWAAEAGLPDGTVSTWEDLTTYFKYVAENKEDVIPWDAGKNSLPMIMSYITSHTDYRTLFGCNVGNYEFWTTSASDTYTVSAPIMEDDSVYDAAECMKEWNEIGVWREDVMNYDGDSRAEMLAGTCGADQHHSETYYTTVKPQMDEQQPGSDVKMYYFGQENNNVSAPMKTHGAAAISANSEHPERALMVYDLLRNDDECYRYINYGIEGEDYIVTDEGKLAYPEGFDSSTQALDANFWCGRNDDLELEKDAWWDGKNQMIEDLNSVAYEYQFENLIIDKNSIEAQQAAMAQVLSEYLPQLAWGKYEDPKAAVDEMREKLLAAGYEDVKASIQKDMDAFVEEQGLK